jgi:hypothetical protein
MGPAAGDPFVLPPGAGVYCGCEKRFALASEAPPDDLED